MRAVYALFLACGLLSVLAAAAALYGLFGHIWHQPTIGPQAQFIIASGFLAASAGWVLTNAITLRLKFREMSLKYMDDIETRNKTAAGLNTLWNDLGLDEIVHDPDKRWKFWCDHYPDGEYFQKVRTLANSYEHMGLTIKMRIVDEVLLRRYFATSLRWFAPRLLPFMEFYQNDPPRAGNPIGNKSNTKTFSFCLGLIRRWDGKEE